MSIIEKAADKLRETQPDPPAEGNRKTGDRHADRVLKATASPRENRDTGEEDGSQPALQIRFKALRKAELVPPDQMQEQIANEYRRIKRPLLANITGRGAPAAAAGQRIMVSSALPGEGKSFTSFNLACSLARERDHSVLLVDGDVLKPIISRALGLKNQPGLMDLLADEAMTPRSIIHQTDIPGLSVLPAGRTQSAATEMLSSRRVDWVMDELSSQPGRVVLFDSPPLLATPETQALALSMGQIVVVVKAGATEQNAVQAALSLLDPEKAVNLLLNQSRKAHGDNYYGYYGYAYGSYGSGGE